MRPIGARRPKLDAECCMHTPSESPALNGLGPSSHRCRAALPPGAKPACCLDSITDTQERGQKSGPLPCATVAALTAGLEVGYRVH